jgi:glutamate/tyrosine decarboxylase-like PLP-dependent enzyme
MTMHPRHEALQNVERWERQWPAFERDETLAVPPGRAEAVLDALGERLRENYPFFHPSYAGQMLKPPHEIALAAYAMAQRINPNNHALDGGPATAVLERECVARLASMFGFDPATSLGHLTSSGTIANLEALWIARSLHPDAAIAHSAEAHYTHERMCEVIGARGVRIAADHRGRMDLDDLRAKLAAERIGTVVVTAGTTSLGAVDPIADVLDLQTEHGFRIHVDAAYGGFFALLASSFKPQAASLNDVGELSPQSLLLGPEDAAAFRAIARCDSVVVDPHKHGLQPYGCGSVLFRDATVGRFYQHDSPYTYFTSDDLHLGEISLECSRAGAAAAALWATLECFPLEPDAGLGPVLRKTRLAALHWAELIERNDRLRLVTEPSLDIVAFYPIPPDGDRRASTISRLTHQVFETGMRDGSFYLAKLNAKPDRLTAHEDLIWDAPALTTLRSVLMKPEHLAHVPMLHERVLAAF